MGAGVEVRDVGSAQRGHDHVLAVVSVPGPVRDELVAEVVAVVGEGDVAVAGEPAEGLVDPAVAQVDERVPFDGVGLAEVGDEGDRVEPVGERPEQSAGFDLGELAVVPDGDHLGAGPVGVGEERGEVPGADHRGLVDHDRGLVVEPGPAGAERGLERGDRLGWDARAALEFLRRPGGQCRADDPVAGGLVGVADGVERERLARPGPPNDHVDCVARNR